MTNKRNTIIILVSIVVAAVIIAGAYVVGNNLKKNKENTVATQSPENKVLYSATVEITRAGFVPATIAVKKGTVVVWTNTDSLPHQVASDPHPNHDKLKGLFSDPLTNGKSFSFTFNKSGTFTYHDHLNPLKFYGTVVVK